MPLILHGRLRPVRVGRMYVYARTPALHCTAPTHKTNQHNTIYSGCPRQLFNSVLFTFDSIRVRTDMCIYMYVGESVSQLVISVWGRSASWYAREG